MKTEILIPMWPNQTATSDKLGCGTRYRDLSSCDSFWVPLRARPVGEGYEFADACSIWSELAIYVWMSADYGVSLELKAYNVHSAGLRKLELLTKTLKWATNALRALTRSRWTTCRSNWWRSARGLESSGQSSTGALASLMFWCRWVKCFS